MINEFWGRSVIAHDLTTVRTGILWTFIEVASIMVFSRLWRSRICAEKGR